MNINGLKVFETIDQRQVEWGEESPHSSTQLSRFISAWTASTTFCIATRGFFSSPFRYVSQTDCPMMNCWSPKRWLSIHLAWSSWPLTRPTKSGSHPGLLEASWNKLICKEVIDPVVRLMCRPTVFPDLHVIRQGLDVFCSLFLVLSMLEQCSTGRPEYCRPFTACKLRQWPQSQLIRIVPILCHSQRSILVFCVVPNSLCSKGNLIRCSIHTAVWSPGEKDIWIWITHDVFHQHQSFNSCISSKIKKSFRGITITTQTMGERCKERQPRASKVAPNCAAPLSTTCWERARYSPRLRENHRASLLLT